jgi:endonuclease/exonuclease/phosphatase family metal-dependent hydrolase
MDFRLATYNVKCFPWTSTPIRDIVRWISRSCDVVALQEIWCRHSAWASAFAAAGWTFLRPPREHHILSVFGSGLAVAWRTDKWQLRDARQYPYLSAVGIDALVSKGWFRVELTHMASQKPLRLINTHMQSDYEVCNDIWRTISEPVRMGQAQQLIESERRLSPAPTLITGDMNTEMCWFPECRWLTRHAGPTFDKGSQVLDHCATWQADQWGLESHRVGRECGELSDHWPVVWHLRWRGDKREKNGGKCVGWA